LSISTYWGALVMSLSTEQQILIEQRISNDSKSAGVAYLLWFLLGGIGMHRLYLGRTLSGLVMMFLMPIGILMMLSQNRFGAFLVIAAAVWIVADLFLISGMVKSQKVKNREKLTAEAIAASQTP
jgi:TM2 domain-containing membrane protein YozV